MKLFLILVESELELLPKSIQNEPTIVNYSKNRGKSPSQIILDSSFHFRAMRKLKDYNRRGRPDIVHFCLLLAQDSNINKNGFLEIYVHTRNDKVIWINPETRLPKNYIRFLGLMEHLFLKGVVKSGNKTLLKITDKTLKELLEELNTWNVILWEKGKPVNLVDFFKTRKNKKLAVMIGAFPHGDFKSSLKLSNEKISIGKESYSAAWALAKVIFSFEQALGI